MADYPTGPFRFCDLPAEVRLNILEHTDLRTPTGVIRWNPSRGYDLPFAVRGRQGAWRPPGALFLVSRAFGAEAREVFLRRNRFVVWPHTAKTAKLMNPSGDYAATLFLARPLAAAASSVRHLRHLELEAFAAFGPGGEEAAGKARENWFRALRRVYDDSYGDGSGLDNLRFLRIISSWHDAPSPDYAAFRATSNPTADIVTIRTFLQERVWPFIDPEHGPPRLPWQLRVELRAQRFFHSRYSIRKKAEDSYEGADRLALAGPFMSHLVSWKPPDQLHDKGHWVEDMRDGEWIEEGWMTSPKK